MFSIIALNFKIFASTCSSAQSFFGLPVWYKYINLGQPLPNGGCNFSNFQIWPPTNLLLVALAILDMLLVVAGIVAVIFVIYGGIQYILSQGEPDRLKGAQSTIINALIGLVISIAAATIVNFIGTSIK